MSALSDLLNSQPVTARQAAELAEAEGIDLRYGTLAGYWAGNHGRPTAASLKKLAQVVPTLTLKQLQEAAWNTSAPLGPYEPPEVAMHLDQWQRRALDDLIRSIVATREARSHGDSSPRTTQPGTPSSAQKGKDEELPNDAQRGSGRTMDDTFSSFGNTSGSGTVSDGEHVGDIADGQ